MRRQPYPFPQPDPEPLLLIEVPWVRRLLGLVATIFIGLLIHRFGLWPDRPAEPEPLKPTTAHMHAPLHHGNPRDVPGLEGIPNVIVAYYDIDATDARGIKAELAAKRPEDGFRHRYDALTSWNYSWHWDGTSDGSCGVGGAIVEFNAQMQLPRLAHRQAVSPAVGKAWDRYITALKKHEANHARQAWQGREWVANEVRNSTCDEANRAGRRAIADIQVQSDNYDDYTLHGEIEGAVFKG